MKLFILSLFAAFTLSLTSCSSGGSTPEGAAEGYIEGVLNLNPSEIAKYVCHSNGDPYLSHELERMVRKAERSIEKASEREREKAREKISNISYDIVDVEYDDDDEGIAKVKVKFRDRKKHDTDRETLKCYLIDGRWYVGTENAL